MLSISIAERAKGPVLPILDQVIRSVFQHPGHCMACQFGAVFQVQFLPDAVAVGLDRLDAQVQLGGDLARSSRPAPIRPEDVELPVREGVDRRVDLVDPG